MRDTVDLVWQIFIVLAIVCWLVGLVYFALLEPIINRAVCRSWGHQLGFGDGHVCTRCGCDIARDGRKTYGI